MDTFPVVCVTVVAESVVEQRLLRDLESAGARGWSSTTGHARGQGFVDDTAWEGGTVRIEALVSEAVADRLLELLARDYFPHYAVVAWTAPARVVRPDRFS